MKPTRIAIIGSGPSGFYAAEALLKQKDFPVSIDMFDRLPTPYGLVRGGVAPDHQKIKSVIAVYEKTALNPNFRFFGNVKLGQDIQVAELRQHYDQIIYAVGNESDRKLGIPGEDLPGSHSATAFVGWYNGHPDFRGEKFDLNQEAVAVVGIGNVAMDVTRILAEDPENLKGTDIAGYALDALRKSKVKTIYILGRRGSAQAAYSPAEIMEIGELHSADLVVLPNEAAVDDISKEDLADLNNKKNVDYVLQVSKCGEGTKSNRKVRLRLLVSPVEVIGENGKIKAVKIERNQLVKDAKGKVAAKGTGQFETLPIGLIFRSVGYRGIPIAGVPFDEKSGKIPNADGRVSDPAGKPVTGEYVVGWAKRGPSGLIGTNRADSVLTVNAMIADLKASVRIQTNVDGNVDSIPSLLQKRGVKYVTFQDWKELDKLEVSRGKAAGKIREKFTNITDMLAALNGAKQTT